MSIVLALDVHIRPAGNITGGSHAYLVKGIDSIGIDPVTSTLLGSNIVF